MCRALYTLENEEQVSKLAAALWAIDYLPEYSNVIRSALIWRQERNSSSLNPYETYVLAEKFINDILERFFGVENE